MSLITVLNSEHGIVVASDRRITEFEKVNDTTSAWYVGTDYERKTFLTAQNHSISYFNDAFFNGVIMSLAIEEFVKSHLNPCTIEDTANAFMKFVQNKSENPPNTWFLITGYDGADKRIYQVYPKTEKKTQLFGNFFSGGQNDIALALWNHSIEDKIIPISNISLTIPGMIELSKFFIEATNTMQRFQCRYCGVSKECDILVITPDSAYWAVPPEQFNLDHA